jgi:hypothetical protein
VGEDSPHTAPEPHHGEGRGPGKAAGAPRREGAGWVRHARRGCRAGAGTPRGERAVESGKKGARKGEEEENEAHHGKGEGSAGGRRRGAARASWRREERERECASGVEEVSREVVFGVGLIDGAHHQTVAAV